MILVRNTGQSSFQFNNIRLIKSHVMQLTLFGVHVVEMQYGTVKNKVSNID